MNPNLMNIKQECWLIYREVESGCWFAESIRQDYVAWLRADLKRNILQAPEEMFQELSFTP
jgi:hypothetical protein